MRGWVMARKISDYIFKKKETFDIVPRVVSLSMCVKHYTVGLYFFF